MCSIVDRTFNLTGSLIFMYKQSAFIFLAVQVINRCLLSIEFRFSHLSNKTFRRCESLIKCLDHLDVYEWRDCNFLVGPPEKIWSF